MTGMSGMELNGIMENYDFSPYKKIVDIGVGNGVLIHTILDASPGGHGIIFDEAHVIEKTIQLIPEHLKEMYGSCWKFF
jgi:tRNA A58 N-methylase Trm61